MSETVELADGTTTTQQALWKARSAQVAQVAQNPALFAEHLAPESGAGRVLLCVDERVQPLPAELSRMEPFRLAGSGILLGKTYEDSLQQAETLLHGRVKLVTWHRGCRAAAEAQRRFGASGDVDEFARRFAEELAGRLGVECVELPRRGPLDFHDARGVVYDGSGRYRPADHLPPMFVVSRALLNDPAPALAELHTALRIAMGPHGFSSRFSEQPFLIVVLAQSQDQLDELMEEVRSQQPYFDPARVKVLGALVAV
ncbi:MAG TPA: hypothetical protein VGM19_12550 [Armatimonadota bacterium]|jgi:hypothetical protein